MLRQVCRSKIYNAVVTDTRVEYEGSLGVDKAVMEAAGLAPYEKVLVINTSNCARFETYVIPKDAGSGAFALYGGAARLGKPGDPIILMSFGGVAEQELADFEGPRVLRLAEGNRLP